MINKSFISALVFLFVGLSPTMLVSGYGKFLGKVVSVSASTGEIIVSIDNGKSVKPAVRLYAYTKDKVIVLDTVSAIGSTVKCEIIPKNSPGKITDVSKGMEVYFPDDSIFEVKADNAEKSILKTGLVKKYGSMEMVYIEGGTYLMGSPENEKGRRKDEKQHKVTVSSFWIGKYEVTQSQYQEIMGPNEMAFSLTGEDISSHAVDFVSWEDAMEFCRRFSKKYKVQARLPYESEWEYACRAGSSTAYFWGNTIDDNYLWRNWKTNPVGVKKPNKFGLYDMSGNVCEWCMDWYNIAYYSDGPENNPKGPAFGYDRVLRGGSSLEGAFELRSAFRDSYDPRLRDNPYGFRIVIVP